MKKEIKCLITTIVAALTYLLVQVLFYGTDLDSRDFTMTLVFSLIYFVLQYFVVTKLQTSKKKKK